MAFLARSSKNVCIPFAECVYIVYLQKPKKQLCKK